MDNPSALVVPSEITRISPFPSGVTLLPSQLGASSPAPAEFTNTYSVELDGTNDYVNWGSGTEQNIRNDFTFAIWIKTTMTAVGTIASLEASGTDDWLFTVNNVAGKARILYHASGFKNEVSTTTVNDGEWHLVGFSFSESDGVDIVVDGIIENSAATSPAMRVTASTELKIGITSVWPFDGNMDEAYLFDFVFDADDWEALYNSGNPKDVSGDGPTGWLRMGDNNGGTGTTITDQGSGGNNATLVNGPVFSEDVPVNTSLPELTNTYSVDFDGTNDFMAADGAASAASSFNGGTWMMWVAPDDASPNTSQTIISFGDDNADSFIQISIGGITQTIITASCTSGGTQQWVINTSDLAWSATNWHHVAIVHNGTEATLYIDGVASGSFTVTTDKTTWHNDIAGLDKCTVGAKISNSLTGQYFDGKIDEVAVCETQLTAANLLEIASATTGKATDLDSYSPVGWWRMGDDDGGTGTTVTNQGSGGSSDGTLTNGPTFSTTVQ